MESKQKQSTRWLILLLLTLSFASSFISRFIWSSSIEVASIDLSLTMSQAGGLMGAFYLGYLFTQMPGGYLADKYPVKYLMSGSLFILAILTYAMGLSFVDNYRTAYIVRMLGGLSSGMILAFCSRVLSDYFVPSERGIAFGILFSAPSLGTLVANIIGPKVIAASNWQTAFKVAAFVILVVGLLDLLFITEKDKEETTVQSDVTFMDGIKNYFSNKQIVLLSISGFLFVGVPIGFSTWANKFMTGGMALSMSQAGLIMTLYALAAMFGSISSGFVAERLQINRKYFMLIILVTMSITLFIFSKQTTYRGLLIFAILFGLFSTAASSQITSWAINIGGDEFAATTSALQNLILQSSNLIFPTVAGIIIDKATVDGVITSYNGIWQMYVGLLVLAIIVLVMTSSQSAAESMK